MAGNRGGVNDERGILFKYSHRYIKEKRPRFFIIENVKGLLSSEGGNTFKTWLNMLAKSVNGAGIQQSMFEDVSKDCAGYYVKWFVLNAKTHGWPHPVPQNRERVFIVGFRDIKDYSQFKAINKKKLNSKLFDILDDNVEPKYYLNSVRYLFPKKEDLKGFVYNGPYINGDTSQTITANYGNCPRTAQFIMTKNHTNLIKETIKKGNRAVNVNNEIAACICASDYLKNQKEANYILLDGTKDAPKALRKLTPNECRKLMGLPETFIQPCSNSQAYKQYGNSIVVNCLAAIFKNMNLNQLK
jgi:DNA (cytosine-5)-methyltransferase 1